MMPNEVVRQSLKALENSRDVVFILGWKKRLFKWITGISFGLTSAVITTLGLMGGLYSGTNSKIVVLAGILTIVIANAFSDALGMSQGL